MNGSVPRDSIIMDLEDESSWDTLVSALKNGEIPLVSPEKGEDVFQQAEEAFQSGAMEAAEQKFRKVLCSVAYCETHLKRKREIVKLCAERLLSLRKLIGKSLNLKFCEIGWDGLCHMYAFNIGKTSERRRLITVIAEREPAHDAPAIAFTEEYEKRTARRDSLPRTTSPFRREKKIPRNAPCPCGSGKKYKRCCGK